VNAVADIRSACIDAHIHVWPETAQANPSRYTAEDHFAVSRPVGVERTVLIQPGMFRFDNTYMMDTVARHKGRFSAVAVVDVDAPGLQGEVVRLRATGARGFRITARPERPWADWPGMQALWRAAREARMAVCPLINPEAFPWVAALCERNPGTLVVIDHLGRVGAQGTVEDAQLRSLCGLAKFPRVLVKVSAFYALGRKAPPYQDLAPMIRQVFETFGPRRLMWASDAPYQAQPPQSYRDSVELIRGGLPFLGAGDKEWLLRRTAEGVFFGK